MQNQTKNTDIVSMVVATIVILVQIVLFIFTIFGVRALVDWVTFASHHSVKAFTQAAQPVALYGISQRANGKKKEE